MVPTLQRFLDQPARAVQHLALQEGDDYRQVTGARCTGLKTIKIRCRVCFTFDCQRGLIGVRLCVTIGACIFGLIPEALRRSNGQGFVIWG